MLRRASYQLVLTIVGLLITTSVVAEKITIGNAKVVVKTVTGIAEQKKRELVLQDDIYHNEKIVTEDESATQLIFLDDTTVTLGPKSQIVLDRYVYDPNKSKGSFVMTATSGAFRFATGKMSKKSYKIHTPAATIGVRGTVFYVEIRALDTPGRFGDVSVTVRLDSGEADLVSCEGNLITLKKPGAVAHLVRKNGSVCGHRQ